MEESRRIGHGSLNVPIKHHPTIRYMVYNGYYKVMSNIPKMGQLPTPVGSNETLGRPAIAFLRSVFVATKRYNSGSGFNETFCPPGHMVPRSGKFKRIFPIPGHMRMGHKL